MLVEIREDRRVRRPNRKKFQGSIKDSIEILL